MKSHIRARLASLVLAVALLVSLLGMAHTVSAHPARQSSDPVATVLAMVDAFNRHDAGALRNLLDPSFEDVTVNAPAGLPPEYPKVDVEIFIRESAEGIHVDASNCQLTAPDKVVCDVTLSGGDVPPLPHPFTETATFTVANGKITRLEETFSPQTLSDIEALLAAQPGMPTTGSTDTQTPFAALAIGLFLLAFGLVVRRANSYRR
jgi:hypothetical protein